MAIFGLRQNGVLITEAAVTAAIPSTSGRIYAEIGDGVDTGLAIANPNDASAEVSFYFTNGDGEVIGSGNPNTAMLSRALGLVQGLIRYFDIASGGRMKVIQ